MHGKSTPSRRQSNATPKGLNTIYVEVGSHTLTLDPGLKCLPLQTHIHQQISPASEPEEVGRFSLPSTGIRI